jgi:RHS repeat-associated protein
VWDAENRLVRMVAPSTVPTGARKTLVFGYDWQDRRISKTVSNWTGSAWTKVLDEKFVNDGWNLLSSLNASNNAVVRSFLWGSDLSGDLQGAGGVGGLVAVSARGSSVSFAAYDGNGNVVGLVNALDGTNVVNYEYGPFGEVNRCSGTAAKSNPFRFSTKYQDDETDMLYYGYRYYSQSIGRWLSRDPIEENGGANLYGFVGNSSIARVDYDGLAGDEPTRNDLKGGGYLWSVPKCSVVLDIGHGHPKSTFNIGSPACSGAGAVGCYSKAINGTVPSEAQIEGVPDHEGTELGGNSVFNQEVINARRGAVQKARQICEASKCECKNVTIYFVYSPEGNKWTDFWTGKSTGSLSFDCAKKRVTSSKKNPWAHEDDWWNKL